MISIIIPVYNGAKTLEETLISIEKQSYTNYEVIIVNDGSTDRTINVFEKFIQQRNLKNRYYFLNQSNQGAPAARNHGAKKAQGKFLFFCDADATLKPQALEKMRQYLMNNPVVSYAYSSFYWGKKLFKVGPFSPQRLQQGPYIHTMALIRRECFPESGWDESIKKFQDWDLWLTMLKNGYQGGFIKEALFTVKPGGTISSWLPSIMYRIAPFLPTVKRYNKALKIIKDKHRL
ncbi:MAG: glycosyltransferase family 2 protein [Patescibacteria group bacterium]|jgi:glycosyltransferase involved in cell wall biosynthesis